MIRILPALLIILGCNEPLTSERTALVAVASNFASTANKLVNVFEKETNYRIKLAIGSTGKHFAQIRNGAPYDAFLAADKERPKILEQTDLAQTDSRFTYAHGRLTLWSPQSDLVDSNGNILFSDMFKHLAIANPRLAPYGRAAEELLLQRGQWDDLKPRLVQGENIAQTLLFVDSGNAELGLVATAHVKDRDGSHWLVPEEMHNPIEQQAVLLPSQPAAHAFLEFLKTKRAQKIILTDGYSVP